MTTVIRRGLTTTVNLSGTEAGKLETLIVRNIHGTHKHIRGKVTSQNTTANRIFRKTPQSTSITPRPNVYPGLSPLLKSLPMRANTFICRVVNTGKRSRHFVPRDFSQRNGSPMQSGMRKKGANKIADCVAMEVR